MTRNHLYVSNGIRMVMLLGIFRFMKLERFKEWAYFHFDHFPKSKIDTESRLEMRMSIFVFQIFLERFDHHKKDVKTWILHCIFKK